MSAPSASTQPTVTPHGGSGDPLPQVRATVRALLLGSPAYATLSDHDRRALAQNMVRLCHAAAILLQEELDSDAVADAGRRPSPAGEPVAAPPLAQVQAAQPELGAAARQVGDITRSVLNAVSFPRFVTELINGVFKGMIESSTQQMHSYVDLLNNVSATLSGFEQSNIGAARARQWLAERYPEELQLLSGDGEVDPEWPEPGEDPDWSGTTEPSAPATLRLREGARFPSEERLRTDLGLDDAEPVPSGGDPERTLVPLARRYLARQRQALLATMVQMGMQRIVVDSGRIHASMRFHVDTRDQASRDAGSSTDWRNTVGGGASLGIGNWGVSANMTNTIGYVTTERTQSSAEINTDLDLTSAVEINFRSDYLPLNRLATSDQARRIEANSLNPGAADETARAARLDRQRADEAARRQALNSALTRPGQTPAQLPADLPETQRGTITAAERAREQAEQRSGGDEQGGSSAGSSIGSTGGQQAESAVGSGGGQQGAVAGTGRQATPAPA